MKKLWTQKEKGSDRVILTTEDMPYKGNPKLGDLNQMTFEINAGKIPENLFSIPFNYIKEIHLQEGKNYIEVFFSHGSNEQFRITNNSRREEVFEYMKENIPGINYIFEEYSLFKAAKTQIIGTVVLSVIVAWALLTIIQIQSGYYMERTWVVIAALVPLGFSNLLLILLAILVIGGISIFRKMRNPPRKHILTFFS